MSKKKPTTEEKLKALEARFGQMYNQFMSIQKENEFFVTYIANSCMTGHQISGMNNELKKLREGAKENAKGK